MHFITTITNYSVACKKNQGTCLSKMKVICRRKVLCRVQNVCSIFALFWTTNLHPAFLQKTIVAKYIWWETSFLIMKGWNLPVGFIWKHAALCGFSRVFGDPKTTNIDFIKSFISWHTKESQEILKSHTCAIISGGVMQHWIRITNLEHLADFCNMKRLPSTKNNY